MYAVPDRLHWVRLMSQANSGYENVTPEEFLDYEGIEYRATSGSRGPQFNIKTCPVCGGNKWKVYLNRDNGYGNCFHGDCGEQFNLWTFAKAVIGTTENSVVGQKFNEIAKGGGWRPKRREKRIVAPALTGDLKLPNSIGIPDANINYLKERGVPVWVARQFGLRMCINGAYKFQDEEGKPKSTVFTGRLIIPIYDLTGKLVTFQGRDVTGKQDPKYLFPSRLPSTARFLYNGHRAYEEGWSHIVMGEGAFDVIATQMAIDGDRGMTGMGAVGSFGKKLTLDADGENETQLQALMELKKRGLKTITILWDGEKSALASACKAADKLSKYNFHVRIGFLPRGKDPAEVPAETVRHAIRTAKTYTRNLGIKIRIRNPYG